MATLTTWLAGQGLSLLLGYASQLILDLVKQARDAKLQDEAAAARAEADQQKGTIAAQQAELEAQTNAPRDVGDAVRRLEEGSA